MSTSILATPPAVTFRFTRAEVDAMLSEAGGADAILSTVEAFAMMASATMPGSVDNGIGSAMRLLASLLSSRGKARLILEWDAASYTILVDD